MAPPLKISADDEEVIDLSDEEVTIDLSNNNNADISPKAEAKAAVAPTKAEPATGSPPVGTAATAPPVAGKPAKASASAGAAPAKAASGGNGKGPLALLHTKNGRSFIVLLVAAVIIGAMLIVPFSNEAPTAVITVDKTDPTDGEAIRISAENSTDPDGRIKGYDWTYPDDFIKFEKEDEGGGDGFSWIWGHFCIKHTDGTQDRTISVTVKDNAGAEDSAEIVMTVIPLVVIPAPELIGDQANYDLNGRVTMYNEDGIFTIEKSDIVQIDDTVKRIYLEYSGTVDAWVLSVPDPVEDGFLQNHTVYERRTLFTMDLLDGSYAETEKHGEQPITGAIEGETNTYIYALKDRAIRMDLEVGRGVITAGDIIQEEKKITGKVTGYPHVQSENNTLHVSDLGESLDISSSDTIEVGSVEIDWLAVDIKAIKVEEIGYVACLEIDLVIVSVDGEAVDDPPTIKYWIADDPYSYPIKTRFEHTTQNDEGTTTTTSNTKKMTDFSRGSGALPMTESEFVETLDLDNWHKHPTNLWSLNGSYDKMSPLTDVNRQGLHDFYETNSHIYQVEKAYQDAWEGDGEFREYMDAHGDAYNVLSLYNETGNEKVWNMTFGEGGSDEFYNIEVSNRRGVTENGEGAVDEDVELSQGIEDIPPVFSFSTCVHRMFLLGDYEGFDKVREELFEGGSNDFHFENATAGQGIRAAYPMPLSGASGEVTEYMVFAMNVERTLTVVVDAVTGQIMYYAEKKGFLDILDLSELLSSA